MAPNKYFSWEVVNPDKIRVWWGDPTKKYYGTDFMQTPSNNYQDWAPAAIESMPEVTSQVMTPGDVRIAAPSSYAWEVCLEYGNIFNPATAPPPDMAAYMFVRPSPKQPFRALVDFKPVSDPRRIIAIEVWGDKKHDMPGDPFKMFPQQTRAMSQSSPAHLRGLNAITRRVGRALLGDQPTDDEDQLSVVDDLANDGLYEAVNELVGVSMDQVTPYLSAAASAFGGQNADKAKAEADAQKRAQELQKAEAAKKAGHTGLYVALGLVGAALLGGGIYFARRK